ncbi:hypothetical protein Dimus_039736 [Dionaea muscipula]
MSQEEVDESIQQRGKGRLTNRGPLTASTQRDHHDLTYTLRRRIRRVVESEVPTQSDVHPQPVEAEMGFGPSILPRVSVADDEMLEAERRTADHTWSAAGSGETSRSRSGREKGTMMVLGFYPKDM